MPGWCVLALAGAPSVGSGHVSAIGSQGWNGPGALATMDYPSGKGARSSKKPMKKAE